MPVRDRGDGNLGSSSSQTRDRPHLGNEEGSRNRFPGVPLEGPSGPSSARVVKVAGVGCQIKLGQVVESEAGG